MRLRDPRYLFGVRPWVFFPAWFALGSTLGWLLDGAPVWLRLLVLAPVGWTMPFYVARMPWITRLSPHARRDGTSRWRAGPPGDRWT
ncbi:hypothetical protein [Blastococcus sp. SYSU DS0617]